MLLLAKVVSLKVDVRDTQTRQGEINDGTS